jgi:hypothetical protein
MGIGGIKTRTLEEHKGLAPGKTSPAASMCGSRRRTELNPIVSRWGLVIQLQRVKPSPTGEEFG